MPMKLSVVIPVYNEKDTVHTLVHSVLEADYLGLDCEVIVIDDGSTDGTVEVLKEKVEPKVKTVIYRCENGGKGSAVRDGLRMVEGNFVIIQDADLEYDPNEIKYLLEPMLRRQADVVFGSRFMGGGAHRVVYFWHMVGNRFLTLLSNMLTNLNLTDMESCYKLFRKEVLDQFEVEENRFGIEPELTAKVARLQCRIFEVGISYYGRTYAEGKKIGWKDGMRAVYSILKYNIWKRLPLTKGS